MQQHERGRFLSEGEMHMLGPADEDGWDTLDWIAAQPWSDGKVATYGCSSSAENQLKLASLGHPAHKAMIAYSAGVGVAEAGPFRSRATSGAAARGSRAGPTTSSRRCRSPGRSCPRESQRRGTPELPSKPLHGRDACTPRSTQDVRQGAHAPADDRHGQGGGRAERPSSRSICDAARRIRAGTMTASPTPT